MISWITSMGIPVPCHAARGPFHLGTTVDLDRDIFLAWFLGTNSGAAKNCGHRSRKKYWSFCVFWTSFCDFLWLIFLEHNFEKCCRPLTKPLQGRQLVCTRPRCSEWEMCKVFAWKVGTPLELYKESIGIPLKGYWTSTNDWLWAIKLESNPTCKTQYSTWKRTLEIAHILRMSAISAYWF